MAPATILWRRLDKTGHDAARLTHKAPYWFLVGTAVFAHKQQSCRLDYRVVCERNWQTLSARVDGWIGIETVRVDIAVDADRRWSLNGVECPDVTGCLDVDLNFSPSTNLLPIRRLGLAIGESASAPAAWLAFPSLRLGRLEQIYHRIDSATYHYESAGGEFASELRVNVDGFVINYPMIWQAEAHTNTEWEK